jgi:protein-S-isoprenylcysteine O-methyltransferase Ste14
MEAATNHETAAASITPSGRDMTAHPGLWSTSCLALRSLLWTILLPGLFAGYVPWRFFGLGRMRFDLGRPSHLLGLLCIGVGAALLAACILEFARSGRGTLSPLDPPRHLVVRGLYRYVRNPMYISVTIIVLGEALLTQSLALGVYWMIWFLSANLFVIGYEEPTLRDRFGASYDAYTRQVGRWIPRFRWGETPR